MFWTYSRFSIFLRDSAKEWGNQGSRQTKWVHVVSAFQRGTFGNLDSFGTLNEGMRTESVMEQGGGCEGSTAPIRARSVPSPTERARLP